MLEDFRELSLLAGRAVMAHYRPEGVPFERKADGSPVSAADLAAHQIYQEGLAARFPAIPLVSEESPQLLAPTALGSRFFLVDPIDGTRGFIAGERDFTLNIALIEAGIAKAALLYAPAHGRLFTAQDGKAWEETIAPEGSRIGAPRPLKRRPRAGPPRILASRTHLDPQTKTWLENWPDAEIRYSSSSLKFALIAADEADLYPRFAPTSAWDTAAGQALVEASGGVVLDAERGQPLRYGLGSSYLNPNFVAAGDPGLL